MPSLEVKLGHGLADDRRSERQRAFDLVESELRRLDVESLSFDDGVVTLTTHRNERGGHAHGEAETLLGAFEDLEAAQRNRLR